MIGPVGVRCPSLAQLTLVGTKTWPLVSLERIPEKGKSWYRGSITDG